MRTRLLYPVLKLWPAFIIFVLAVGCRKEAFGPSENSPARITDFTVTQSRLTLLQGNTGHPALTLNWQVQGQDKLNTYTIEVDQDGNGFEDKLEIGTTDQSRLDLTVDELNRQICKLIPPGTSAKIAIRVRANPNHSAAAPVYSDAAAVWISTYQEYREYNYPQYMKIPGNYQSWVLSCAPQIVSENNNGEYEGYVRFTNAYPQFLMVKGNQWTQQNTFEYIGSNKFGFGGSVFSIFGGPGIYLLKASTQTNTWSYKKINNWALHGNAVAAGNTDPQMTFDNATQTWSVTASLQKGEFRILANNDEANSLGQKIVNGYMVPAASGNNFVIEKAGTFFIKLGLLSAGNYSCSVVRVVNQ